jgi:hypothetical protein
MMESHQFVSQIGRPAPQLQYFTSLRKISLNLFGDLIRSCKPLVPLTYVLLIPFFPEGRLMIVSLF